MFHNVVYCGRYNTECPYFHGCSKYLICTNVCDCANKKTAIRPSTKMMVRQNSARAVDGVLKGAEYLGFQEVLKRYAGELQKYK